MPADDGDIQSFRQPLKGMGILMGVNDGREQQGVVHRVVEDDSGALFLGLQKTHVEGDLGIFRNLVIYFAPYGT